MGKKQMSKEEFCKIDTILKNGERKELFIKTWHDHVMNKDTVLSFTTIVKDTLMVIEPREDEILVPFSELHGDYELGWIILLDVNTGDEIMRKSTKTVDAIHWKQK
jgi:hypothetical protein